MTGRSLVLALAGLALTLASGHAAASWGLANAAAGKVFASNVAIPAEPIHYRIKKHRRTGEPFILRQPDYGTLPYLYDHRPRVYYSCVPPTAAQFFYCRERFKTFDPVTGAWVSYAPYGHLCSCR